MANKFNPAMRHALNNIRGKIKTFTPKGSFPPVESWKGDGIDHINIGYNVGTELGNLLSLDSPLKLRHPLFGHFETAENFRLYIQTEEKDDRLRYARVVDARRLAKTYKYKRPVNLHAIIMDTVYIRIMMYPRVAEMITESVLPFENYYIHPKSGIRIRPRSFSWLIPGFEEIRNALKEGREPNFSFLMDRESADIYEFVLPEVKEINKNTLPSKKIKAVLSSVKNSAPSNEVLTEGKFRKARRKKKKDMNEVTTEVEQQQEEGKIGTEVEQQQEEGKISLSFDPTETGQNLEISQETLEKAEEEANKES